MAESELLYDHDCPQSQKLEKDFWDPFSHMNDVSTPQCLFRIKRLVPGFIWRNSEFDVSDYAVDTLFASDRNPDEASWDLILKFYNKKFLEIKAFYEDPPPYIYIVHDEKDMTIIHALIIGSHDTPYEGGFFYFLLKIPGSYPLLPPWVKFMTTDGGNVRMNPNLYKNGKVCLSILGTWNGPGWSPANSLSSCLISIQSLLCEKPYHNEPGWEDERYKGDCKRYNEIIQHETLRVAVCGMVENETGISIPESLVEVMEKMFLELYDIYEATAMKNMNLNNQKMQDPFGERRGYFQYENILKRLSECKERILTKLNNQAKDNITETSSSSSSDLDDPPSQSENSQINNSTQG